MNTDSLPLDPLDREIAAKEAAVGKMEATLAEMERAIAVERIKLDSLRHAATLRPVVKMNGVGQAHIDAQVVRRRGKQKGTISNQWRAVMGKVVGTVDREPLPPEVWSAAAHEIGYKMAVKSARDWLRRGIGAQLGFIDRDGDSDRYSVSTLAIEKFNLRTAAPSQEVSGDGAA